MEARPVSLLDDIERIIACMAKTDRDLAERMIVSAVRVATGKRGGRRADDPTVHGERKIALAELKEPLDCAELAQGVSPTPPSFSLSGSLSGSNPDPSKPLDLKVVRKSAGETAEFRDWYGLYPKKRSRADAWKAWQQVAKDRPAFDVLRAALDWQRMSKEWTKDGGAFVPFPATYLRGHRWADERPGTARPPKPPTGSAPPESGPAWMAELTAATRDHQP